MVAQFKQQTNKQEKARTPKYNRPHFIIPREDSRWIRTQKINVRNLFDDCWDSDPYGSRWMPLQTTLSDRAFRGARKVLEDSGLFKFRLVIEIIQGKRVYVHQVWNIHGARNSFYWRGEESTVSDTQENEPQELGVQNDVEVDEIYVEDYVNLSDLGIDEDDLGHVEPTKVEKSADKKAETSVKQELQNLSGTVQKLLINLSNKVMRREDSSTPQQPPAPQGGVVVEEEKTDAVPLTLTELEDAYWEMRETESEPTMRVKAALLNSRDQKHNSTLQNMARRFGWELPCFGTIPENVDTSFKFRRPNARELCQNAAPC